MHFSQSHFHQELSSKSNKYVHGIYSASRNFPNPEIYGVTSQIRRASLSVMLNYIEGYARQSPKVYKNFLEIAYGSLRESQYLLEFCKEEKFITYKEFNLLYILGDEIGAMLWKAIERLKK